jgi:lipid A 3-O-deacylase
MRGLFSGLVCVVVAMLACGPAYAQLLGPLEVRGGVFAHSVDELTLDMTRIQDANVELLIGLPTLDQMIGIGQIRPHVGATVNFGDLESMAYAGLSWTVPVFDTPVFIEGSFGAAVHNGESDGATPPGRNLGCSFLFRESVSVGVNVTESASIMATLEHASHAHLCGNNNRGLTNLGVRVGWKF